jgi:hypothetical protein
VAESDVEQLSATSSAVEPNGHHHELATLRAREQLGFVRRFLRRERSIGKDDHRVESNLVEGIQLRGTDGMRQPGRCPVHREGAARHAWLRGENARRHERCEERKVDHNAILTPQPVALGIQLSAFGKNR